MTTRARRRTLGSVIVAAALLVPAGALASGSSYAPIPGATYNGNVQNGTLSIGVSADGTLVTSYSFVGINGTNSKGGGCTVGGQGQSPAWGGAPITSGSFDYSAPGSFDLSGAADGAQSLSGTISVTVGFSGASDGCSTGVIHWSATTDASLPASGTSTTSGSSGAGGGQSQPAGVGRTSLAVRISLRRRSESKMAGVLKSANSGCVARRTVYLWHGRKRIGTGHSTAKGAFTFGALKRLHNRPVRATVKVMRTSKLWCAAASSTFVRS